MASKPKSKSRAVRWTEACGKALDAFTALEEALSNLEGAISDLRGVQEEYEEWKDNLPPNLQSSALGEKLEAVCGLAIEDIHSDLQTAIEEAQGIIDEANEIDLPQGFGRD